MKVTEGADFPHFENVGIAAKLKEIGFYRNSALLECTFLYRYITHFSIVWTEKGSSSGIFE